MGEQDHNIYVPYVPGKQRPTAPPVPLTRVWDARLTQRGVTLVPANSRQPTAGSHYWRLAEAHYLDEVESAGRHHIFVEASPAASALVEWDGGSHTLRCNEQGKADFPMYAAGWGYRVRMAEGASDEVRGMGLGTVEQPHMGHHVSYRLVFWRVVQQEEPMAQGIVAAPAGVNVRSGPGTTYAIVEALPQGTPVNILEERDGWYRIGDGRWVFAAYVQRSGPPRNEQEAWQRASAFTLSMEGGLSTDPHDPGNYTPDGRFVGTKWGISARQYPHLDIPNLTKEEALEIYRRDYWIPSGAATAPWPLALVVFDLAVNQGVGEARRMLAESGGNLWLLMALRLEDYTEAGTWPYHGKAWVRRAAKLMREIARG